MRGNGERKYKSIYKELTRNSINCFRDIHEHYKNRFCNKHTLKLVLITFYSFQATYMLAIRLLEFQIYY